MELMKEAYEALEDIVGPDYISQDPAIRDTYNQVWGNKLVFGEKWSNRPAAVLLPGTTEEVQAIVRACNRYKISFKPFSSGFEVVSTSLVSENSILLDLKRMNRIIEIDTKNMHAVVEPYVSVYRLEMELAKHGLYIGTISAGPEAGVIATSCCHFGSGSTQVFTGGLGRNVLGCEWVLPTGEIIRMGSAEAGNGWFSADGPGFGLRGILRGHSGANGGNGIITRVSHKLYPWYGPPEWELAGSPPAIKQLEKIPDGYKFFIFTFPNTEKAYDALREVAQAEIAYSAMQYLGTLPSEGNDEFWAMLQEILKDNPPNPEQVSLQIVIGANTRREMEYREKCLFKVCEKWGGFMVPQLNDPNFLAWKFSWVVWSFGSVRDAFRSCSEFFISPCTDATEDMIKLQRKAALETMRPYIEKGALFDLAELGCFHLPYENHSTGSHIENVAMYDPYDEKSLEGVRGLIAETFDPQGKFNKFGVPCLGGGLQIETHSHVNERWGPVYDNYDVWLRKIKQMLDPNCLGDWSAYVPPVFP
jgi:glycolate oxidase